MKRYGCQHLFLYQLSIGFGNIDRLAFFIKVLMQVKKEATTIAFKHTGIA